MPRLLLLPILAAPLALAATASAQDESQDAAPQNDWMIHMDRSSGAWRFLPERPVLVPGGMVQLMVFGNGQHSLVLDHSPSVGADIGSKEGTIRTASFAAPTTPGAYPFHDKYHPEARGVLVVRDPPADRPPTIGVVPGGYESRFSPARLEVEAGARIRFLANGTFGHNLQAVDHSFSAGDVAPGGEGAFLAPTTPGSYAFECRFHKEQGMVGTLLVTSRTAAANATSPAGPTTGTDTEARGLALGVILVTVALCAYMVRNQRTR